MVPRNDASTITGEAQITPPSYALQQLWEDAGYLQRSIKGLREDANQVLGDYKLPVDRAQLTDTELREASLKVVDGFLTYGDYLGVVFHRLTAGFAQTNFSPEANRGDVLNRVIKLYENAFRVFSLPEAAAADIELRFDITDMQGTLNPAYQGVVGIHCKGIEVGGFILVDASGSIFPVNSEGAMLGAQAVFCGYCASCAKYFASQPAE